MEITLRDFLIALYFLIIGACVMYIKASATRRKFRDRKIAKLETLPVNCRLRVRGRMQDRDVIYWLSHEDEPWSGFLFHVEKEFSEEVDQEPLDVDDIIHVVTVSDGTRQIKNLTKEGVAPRTMDRCNKADDPFGDTINLTERESFLQKNY